MYNQPAPPGAAGVPVPFRIGLHAMPIPDSAISGCHRLNASELVFCETHSTSDTRSMYRVSALAFVALIAIVLYVHAFFLTHPMKSSTCSPVGF